MVEDPRLQHGLRAPARARDAHRRKLVDPAARRGQQLLEMRPPVGRIREQRPERAPVVAELRHHGGHLPGRPASHGCVRLPNAFAAKLFAATRLGTEVLIAEPEGPPSGRA